MKSEARAATAVAVLAFLPFLAAFTGGFVWDDHALVETCLGIRGFGGRHLWWMLSTHHMANWQPLGWLSLAVDLRVWGLDPRGFHLTNQVLHAVNAALFYLVARWFLERPGALVAALFFAVHPMRVESVAWISERRDVLSGFFFLLCIHFYLKGLRLRALVALALGLLCKPILVATPLVLLILDRLPLRRPERWGTLLREKIPFGVTALLGATAAVWAQHGAGNFVSWESYGVTARLAQAVIGLGFYIEKTALPLALSPLYPLGESLNVTAFLRAVAVLVATEATLRACGAGRAARLALWFYYFLLLAPVAGFLQNGPQGMAVRYSYLSCLGWALAAGAGFTRLPKAARVPLAAATMALLGSCAWLECGAWRDDVSLWMSAARALPESPEIGRRLASVDAQVRAQRALNQRR